MKAALKRALFLLWTAKKTAFFFGIRDAKEESCGTALETDSRDIGIISTSTSPLMQFEPHKVHGGVAVELGESDSLLEER